MNYPPSTYPLVIAFGTQAEAEAFLAAHGVKDDARIHPTHAIIDALDLPAAAVAPRLAAPSSGSAADVLSAADAHAKALSHAVASVNALVSAASITAHLIDAGQPVTSKPLRDALAHMERGSA